MNSRYFLGSSYLNKEGWGRAAAGVKADTDIGHKRPEVPWTHYSLHLNPPSAPTPQTVLWAFWFSCASAWPST